jgi:hypothetical protein
MIKKRMMAASRDPNFQDHQYVLRGNEPEAGNIVFHAGNSLEDNTEMLKITKTGFYVRGILVEQDDKEAEIVYNAFREFLTYHALARNY